MASGCGDPVGIYHAMYGIGTVRAGKNYGCDLFSLYIFELIKLFMFHFIVSNNKNDRFTSIDTITTAKPLIR